MNYDPSILTVNVAGQVSLTFNSDRELALAYNFEGQTGTLNLVPQIFGGDLQHPPKLLALIQGNLSNGYVDIDLSTFTGVQKNPGGSFYGADYDASTNNIVLSSAFSGSTQPYSFVSAVNGTVSAGLNLPQQGAQVAPVKCEPSNSVRPGLCYYGFGNNFDGRITVGLGRNVVETVTLPDAALGRIPTQLAIISNTLVVKTLSPAGTTDVLHTLNLGVTPRTWGTPIVLLIKANGIDIKGNNVYVAGFTTQFVFKVVRVDITTGAVQDLNWSLPASQDVALSEDTMFVSVGDRVKAYRLSDNTLLGDTLLPGAEKLVYFGGNLYVSNPAGNLYKMDTVTRLKVNEMSIPLMKSGDLVIIAP